MVWNHTEQALDKIMSECLPVSIAVKEIMRRCGMVRASEKQSVSGGGKHAIVFYLFL